ncbi:hypothetical protein RAH32_02045 [Paracoccus sp. WLY502]|uniref:hypothetical protein n=1 Tax=Paracoccus yibinensis TaxID=3068891 RepID=UPI002796BEE6|nr:hypothetical protein [Paracoccus sp. WLY502]MDQ1899226.1 hypothetical protein [Paracoccus sp. WLY502]
MRPASCPPRIAIAALAGAAILSGCAGGAGGDRPPAKPATMTARVATPGAAPGKAPLTLARISTKSGEILILEPDGTVTTMALDSPQGQDAFAVTEADLMALNANLDLDLGGMVAADLPPRQTAQEKALEEFAARTQPALPTWAEGTELDPEDFLGARVAPLDPKGAGDLVEVTANLRKGVDADIAFSYATCALAGWAKRNGEAYGRHVRTLQDTRDGKLTIGAAFTLSDQRPMGLRVMETEDTLRECKERGIPAA